MTNEYTKYSGAGKTDQNSFPSSTLSPNGFQSWVAVASHFMTLIASLVFFSSAFRLQWGFCVSGHQTEKQAPRRGGSAQHCRCQMSKRRYQSSRYAHSYKIGHCMWTSDISMQIKHMSKRERGSRLGWQRLENFENKTFEDCFEGGLLSSKLLRKNRSYQIFARL